MFSIIISALHVSGGPSAHYQEPIELYVQPPVLSCFPTVYRWCGCVGIPTQPHEPLLSLRVSVAYNGVKPIERGKAQHLQIELHV